jgi:hypothetical protein
MSLYAAAHWSTAAAPPVTLGTKAAKHGARVALVSIPANGQQPCLGVGGTSLFY